MTLSRYGRCSLLIVLNVFDANWCFAIVVHAGMYPLLLRNGDRSDRIQVGDRTVLIGYTVGNSSYRSRHSLLQWEDLIDPEDDVIESVRHVVLVGVEHEIHKLHVLDKFFEI
jgi:hypothetical protein